MKTFKETLTGSNISKFKFFERKTSMKTLLLIISFTICLLSFTYNSSLAQHTFSICAVDISNNYVGGSGASCTNFGKGTVTISDVLPNVGVIHTQAGWLPQNQNYAHQLMVLGLLPQQIIDSLVAHDYQNNPAIRQYGIVDLIGGGRSAAYTGGNCPNWKGHLLGQTYAIAGNILQGPHILDSMRSRFLNTTGIQPVLLALKLMAALQGAKVPGADIRCTQFSSKSAFIRVAKPTDPLSGPYWLDLYVNQNPTTVDPIDSLQTLFNIWLGTILGITPISSEIPKDFSLSQNYPNPFNPTTHFGFRIANFGLVQLKVFNALGEEVAMVVNEELNPGSYEISFNGSNLPSGVYMYQLIAGDPSAPLRMTKKMVLIK